MTSGAGRIRGEILSEASRWFVEMHEHPEDEATRRAFDGWLRRSPEHMHAFLQVSGHWEESTPRPGAPVESIDELIAIARSEPNVVSLTKATRLSTDVTMPSTAQAAAASPRARWRPMLLAAGVLLSVTVLFAWVHFYQGTYSTGVGEQRSLRLADGSTVELNSNTRIRVKYSSRERHIDLLEGQALFQVAKNRAQPFIVQSGSTQVRAIGTQFDVYRKPNGTVVTVVEGRVSVGPAAAATDGAIAPSNSQSTSIRQVGGENEVAQVNPAASAGQSPSVVFVDGGQQLTLAIDAATATTPTRLGPADLEAATAWTERRLIFKGAPLSQVVSEFNRYSERPIVVTDAQIAAIPISGVFSSNDPTDLLRFLREVGAYEVRETRGAIEISPGSR